MNAKKFVNIVMIGILITGLGTVLAHAQSPPSSRHAHKRQQPRPIGYAVGLDSARGITQFGVLDIATGAFVPIADLLNSAQGLGRDEQGRLYAVDADNNLVRINRVTGRTT